LYSFIIGVFIKGGIRGYFMFKKNAVIAAILMVSMLSACQGKVDQQLVAEPDPVSLRLANAVDRASTALKTLASIEQSRNPNMQIESVSNAPQELRRTMSVDWDGPVEPIARTVVERAGYKIKINGNEPSTPIIISLKAREKQVVELLRDIGLQAGRRADVVVDVESKTVELNYASMSDY